MPCCSAIPPLRPKLTRCPPSVITKNGITRLGGAPALDLSKFETDKKITDEEVLKMLEQPLARNTGKKKSKSKKKKPAKKAAAPAAEESGDDSDDSDE